MNDNGFQEKEEAMRMATTALAAESLYAHAVGSKYTAFHEAISHSTKYFHELTENQTSSNNNDDYDENASAGFPPSNIPSHFSSSGTASPIQVEYPQYPKTAGQEPVTKSNFNGDSDGKKKTKTKSPSSGLQQRVPAPPVRSNLKIIPSTSQKPAHVNHTKTNISVRNPSKSPLPIVGDRSVQFSAAASSSSRTDNKAGNSLLNFKSGGAPAGPPPTVLTGTVEYGDEYADQISMLSQRIKSRLTQSNT
jgi:hypothetical protein